MNKKPTNNLPTQFEQSTIPGVVRGMWTPEITPGPIEVSVNSLRGLLEISRINQLIETLSPDEQEAFQHELQQVINRWSELKNLPTV